MTAFFSKVSMYHVGALGIRNLNVVGHYCVPKSLWGDNLG